MKRSLLPALGLVIALLTQNITLSGDGNSLDSTLKYEVFDQAG